MKKLIFEGAGWEVAESNGVGNCRIRTRIKNNDKRIIYLEMGGTPKSKYMNTIFDFPCHIDHIFYCDKKDDLKFNYSKELSDFSNAKFEYTKKNILNFVNKNLNCSFSDVVVENDGARVHDTKKPLCSSIKEDK